MQTTANLNPWAASSRDPVRARFESAFFEHLLGRLLDTAPGGRVLDLGCGDALVARLCDGRMESYRGVDLFPPEGVEAVEWDLRDGLGPGAEEPFDLCVATFGVASHMAPAQLERLLTEVAAAAAPGAVIAVEALGLHSLEWPRIWSSPIGDARVLPYQLAGEVSVHPWHPDELRRLFADCGLQWVAAYDRTVQAGPKLRAYWPGLPNAREGLALLSNGDPLGADLLTDPLPPLPAHPAAAAHHALAGARRALVERFRTHEPRRLARAVWALEPSRGRGLGHGLVAVGRAPG